MTRQVHLTLTEDEAYALKKCIGISMDNLRGKVSRYRDGSKEKAIASTDFESLRTVETALVRSLNEE
jgi:hypothetical protein